MMMNGPIEPRVLLAMDPASQALAAMYKMQEAQGAHPLHVTYDQKEVRSIFDGVVGPQVVLLYDEVTVYSELRFEGEHVLPPGLGFIPRFCVSVPNRTRHDAGGEWHRIQARRLLEMFDEAHVRLCHENKQWPWGTSLPPKIVKKAEKLGSSIPFWAYCSTIQTLPAK